MKRQILLSLFLAIILSWLTAQYIYPFREKFDFSYQQTSWLMYLSIAVIIILLTYILYSFLCVEIAKAKLQKQYYYPEYCIFTLFITFLLLTINAIFFSINTTVNVITYHLPLGCILWIIGIYFFARFKTKPLDLEKLKKQFAYDAVSQDDKSAFPEFVISAKNAASGIVAFKKAVNVVFMRDSFGMGKSSYMRMVVENIATQTKHQMLYSYMSLTETNEAADFSRLFADRWFKTLKEQYPIFDLESNLSLLSNILRESERSVMFSALTTILSKFNFPIIPTKSFDESQNVPRHVARMFANIPEINQQLWVINIDEIERAPFDEIYRTIEIIERFRNASMSGFPLKIVFLISITDEELKQRIDEQIHNNEKSRLIRSFFFDDYKTCEQNLYLPPLPNDEKRSFIIRSINKVIEPLGLYSIKDKEYTYVSEPKKQFLSESEALGWIIEHNLNLSPRLITRICQELGFFYNCFQDLDGKLMPKEIALCDAIVVALIKIKYPFLIKFLNDYCTQDSSRGFMYDYKSRGLLKESNGDQKIHLELLLKNTIGHQQELGDNVVNLVAVIAYYLLSQENNQENIEDYGSNRTSYFHTGLLKQVLNISFQGHNALSHYKTYKSKNHREELSKKKNEDLLEYSSLLSSTQGSTVEQNLDVVEEWLERLEGGENHIKVTLQPLSSEKSLILISDAMYQILFALNASMEKFSVERDLSKKDTYDRKIWLFIQKLFKSKKVTIEAKYIFLNGFLNKSRVNSENNVLRMQSNFRDHIEGRKEELEKLVVSVFDDANRRYFSGGKSIYQNEENFAYVLFQSWNGKADTDNVELIRKAAKKDLHKYPRALEYYWDERDKGGVSSNFEKVSYEYLVEATQKALKDRISKEYKESLSKKLEAYQNIMGKVPHDAEKQSTAEIHREFDGKSAHQPLMYAMIHQGLVDVSVSHYGKQK
jgi:hypothetical protein